MHTLSGNSYLPGLISVSDSDQGSGTHASSNKGATRRRIVLSVIAKGIAGWWIGWALMVLFMPAPGTVTFAEATTPQGHDRIAQLIERGDCWTGQAPADVDYPAAVVVTRPDGRVVLSARLADAALTQVFGGEDAGLEVHAFCASSR